MDVKKCLQMLRDIKDVAFATVDDFGYPRIRMMDVMYVDEEKLVFCTARGKSVYQEILNHPHIAITGMNQHYEMIRLHGIAEKMENQKVWIDHIFLSNPSMNRVYPEESRYILEAFCIKNGELEYFHLGSEPIVRYEFLLGEGYLQKHKYIITNQCISCGKCQSLCPQKCIVQGNPYFIQQDHCLHCGLCFEQCPIQAIIKEK